MRKIGYILALTVAALHMEAQQVGMYNHYFFKPFFYNPAYAGHGESTEAMLLNRSQWMGFSNGPQLNVLTVDGGLKEKKAGLGISLISDRRGINRRAGASLSYSYRFNINEDAYVALGLSVGAISQSIDYSKVITESYSDLTLFSSSQQKTTIDGNAGLLFGWKGLELSASAPQLLGNRIDYRDNSSVTRVSYTQARHYIASLKYKFLLSEEKEMYLAPQGLVRIIPNAPLQYDGNLTFWWKNKFWIGGTYKSDYAVSANAGVTLNKSLDVGYSYEIIMGNLAKYGGLSHEIMVNYHFGRNKKSGSDEPETNGNGKVSAEYEHKLDSLHQELDESKNKADENDRKIKELNEKLEQLKKQMQKMQMQGGIGDYDPYNPSNNNNGNNSGNNTGNKGNPNSSNTGNNGGNNSGNNGSNTNNGNNTGNKGNPNSINTGNNGGNNSGNNGSNTNSGNNTGNKGNPNSTNAGNNGSNNSGNNGSNTNSGNNTGNKGNPNSTNAGNNSGNNTASSGNPNTNNTGNNGGNTNSATSNSGMTTSDAGLKSVEDNVVMIASPAADYKNSTGSTPSKGYYVVVGTFFYQDFAMNEAKRFKTNGYSSSNWMYSNSKQYNYVYIKKTGSKQEAIKAVKEIQQSGVSDAWIKVLE